MSILRKAVLATAGAIAAALVLPTINAEPPAVGSPEAKAGQGNGAGGKAGVGKAGRGTVALNCDRKVDIRYQRRYRRVDASKERRPWRCRRSAAGARDT